MCPYLDTWALQDDVEEHVSVVDVSHGVGIAGVGSISPIGARTDSCLCVCVLMGVCVKWAGVAPS